MRVDVYYNLHKHKLSLKSREKETYGLVVKHAGIVNMRDCEFIVSQRGRQRVVDERQKNVHAYVRGRTSRRPKHPANPRRIKYNPYKYDSFVYEDTEEPVHRADWVRIEGKNIIAYNPS